MRAFGEQFLSLHRPGVPLLLPNPWDVGSARLLASLGFEALATTSVGFAATLGRFDGQVTREEAIAHAAAIAAAVDVPVTADLEDGFGEDPETVDRASAPRSARLSRRPRSCATRAPRAGSVARRSAGRRCSKPSSRLTAGPRHLSLRPAARC